MIKTGRKRLKAWSMMGLLVVGLHMGIALPARAIPINYILEGGANSSGVFSLDQSLTTPFVTWDINATFNTYFSNISDLVFHNLAIHSGQQVEFDLNTNNALLQDLTLRVVLPSPDFAGLWIMQVSALQGIGSDIGFISQVQSPVPELPTGGLFMIGLLVLAGARWWTHRQERLQLG